MSKEKAPTHQTLESKGPIDVKSSDLPLSCPRPFFAVANLHPRIYLPIEESGHVTCPYCGTEYKLVE